MFKPSLKSIWTLVVLALMAYGLYNWAERSRVPVKRPHHEEKLAAARLMESWIGILRDAKAPAAAFVDEVNDPDRTLLIGQKHTPITSTDGNHQAKLATTNPNTAAMMVQIFKEAGLERGDKVALGVTGSFPGLNLAAYAACRVLELEPVIITSVSSSWYGANDPDFTWLDMEKVLVDNGQITFRSVAASIGGADDRGRSLSPEGRALVRAAIERNGVGYLNPESLEQAVDGRIRVYREAVRESLRGYRAYINIGGGVVSLGHPDNAHVIPLGYTRHLQDDSYPAKGVVHHFSDNGVSIINFKYVPSKFAAMLKKHGIPWRPGHVPLPGEGSMFAEERYDLRVVGLAVAIMAVMVLLVIRFDLRMQRLGEMPAGPDEHI
ncbi:MAG: poly-gamma-glutamate system protein [bacterium]|jgi:poly-gamma-glutamate system protein|nr:poly-gamma-glutamate system protein [bacterium]